MTMGFASYVTQPSELYHQFLQARKFDDTDQQTLGLQLLTPDETQALIGHTKDWSVKIPYYGLDGVETGFTRIRLLMPKTKMKYSQRRSSGAHIYFPPTLNWSTLIKDVTKPIIITEGEFKAWSIVKAIPKEGLNHAVIGLAGVTSWGNKTNETPLHKDLMEILWRKSNGLTSVSRQVYILFDYDGKEDNGEPNEQVAIAEAQLAKTLRGLGADVHLCRVGKYAPAQGDKYAIDDHLNSGKALTDVLINAEQLSLMGTPDLKTLLYEFRTQYAFFNGDVIRLSDGHGFSYSKAKVDAGHLRYTFTNPQGVVKHTDLLDEYKAWPKKLNLKSIDVYPEYQGYTITPDGCYNLLKDWKYSPIEGDVQPYLDFCKYFFRDLPEFEDFFHNWVAQIIQQPWKKNFTSIIFASSLEGIGKSALAEFIAGMMGVGLNCPAGICGPDEIFKEKNDVLSGKLLVVVNEPSSDREDHQKTLKHLVTSDFINIDKKYGLKYTTRNYINLIMTTNAAYVTKMSKNSRRDAIYMPKTLTREEGMLRYKALEAWAKFEHGNKKVLNWYMCRDLGGYNPTDAAPESKHKDESVKMSQSSIEDFADELYDLINNELSGVAAFRPAQIEVLAESLTGLKHVKAKALVYAFSKLGQVDMNGIAKIDGVTTRFHIYQTKECGYNFKDLKVGEIVTATKNMVNKHLNVG